MRSEQARFLDQRERRANDESSPFSALGENGRGFDATAPSLYFPGFETVLGEGGRKRADAFSQFDYLPEHPSFHPVVRTG
jgi:hypothetical protein